MGRSLTQKIIESHYVSGNMVPGEEVFIRVDQTLTHDINAVMTYLAFEAIGLDRFSQVLLFSTEGNTDPMKFRKVLWDGEYPTV